MKKLLSALIVTFSLISFGAAFSFEYRVGLAMSQGAWYGIGKEVNTTAITEESGAFEANYASVFGEIAVNDRISFGLEYVPEDISTPTNTNAQLDKVTATPAGAVKTNTAKATFQDILTAYVQADIWGGLYAKLGYIQASVITNESLGTGGSYGNVDTTGAMIGVGYNHDLDNGWFVRGEVQAQTFQDVKATNSSETTKVITVSDMMGAQGSIRIGKTF